MPRFSNKSQVLRQSNRRIFGKIIISVENARHITKVPIIKIWLHVSVSAGTKFIYFLGERKAVLGVIFSYCSNKNYFFKCTPPKLYKISK